GRDRIAQRSRALQLAVVDPTRPLTALDVAGALATMQAALNRDDPHYRYDLRTSVAPPPTAELQSCAFAETRKLADGGYLTILVVPKHRYSLQDAPIQGTLTVSIPDPLIAAKFQ